MSAALVTTPRRVLMTLDAVGGVWRYALDLTRQLGAESIHVLLVGLGPRPSPDQRTELETLGNKSVFWLDEPLDWLAGNEQDIQPLRTRLTHLVHDHGIDLLHLNLPSQAQELDVQRPIVAVSHSCVTTWWKEVKGSQLPPELSWQLECNLRGLRRADVVLAPSRSHAAALIRSYGPLRTLRVLHNASPPAPTLVDKEPFVLSAGRWWDQGKNGELLDEAAARCRWPVLMAGAMAGPHGERLDLRHARSLGHRPATEVAALMARAALFAAPSRYEPFGLAVLEAATRGCALVLADIPTFRELWNGVAFFAPVDDPAAFAEAFDRLADDREQRVLLGRLARQRAQQFSHRSQAEGLLAAYREASRLATRRAA